MSAICLLAAVLTLDGAWDLRYWPEPEAGSVRTLAAVPADAKRVPATVPGNCELDLVKAGVLPEMEIGLNVRLLRPYECYQWLYAKSFDFTPPSPGVRSVLVFEGIDTFADVFLNGERIGSTENMLVAHRFDVTDRLKKGRNAVQVLIRSAFREAQKHDVGELGFHMGFADGEPIRKAAHMGGWDIFPRVYCAGLWRGVRLETVPSVTVDNVAWMFGDFNPSFTWCNAKIHFRVKGPASAFAWENSVRATLSRNGKVCYRNERKYVAVQNQLRFGIDKPVLWWPKGMGEAALYDATVEVLDANGKAIASDTRKVGIRLVQLERDDVHSAERPGQFLFRVNGQPCYVRGSNWVPLDAFHGRDAERIVPTLEMFEDLNCNMVRVWGGGVYEPDLFFDWCDAHGLMVWQDFMTGCAVFPQDDRYAKLTAEEVKAVVLRFRNHPALVLWSGNNENDGAGGFGWNAQREFKKDCNLDRNSRRTIPDVLFEYDVTRPYLPSSPYESPDVRAGKAKPSEMHLWGARAAYKVPFYTNSPCWFASEMGYHGCPNRASLERMMTPKNVYPWTSVTGTDPKRDYRWNAEWMLKASDPQIQSFGFNRNSLMTNQVKLMFDEVPTDLDDFIFASQVVQAEAMKLFVELFRSQKFTKKNGLIWWNVRDGWPQISDAVVDWYGGKKRAYYAIRAVQQDQLVTVRDDGRVFAVNDTLRPVKGHAKVTDRESGRTAFEKSYDVPANAAVEIGRVAWTGRGLLDIVYEQDGKAQRNWFLYGEQPFDFRKVKEWLK